MFSYVDVGLSVEDSSLSNEFAWLFGGSKIEYVCGLQEMLGTQELKRGYEIFRGINQEVSNAQRPWQS